METGSTTFDNGLEHKTICVQSIIDYLWGYQEEMVKAIALGEESKFQKLKQEFLEAYDTLVQERIGEAVEDCYG